MAKPVKIVPSLSTVMLSDASTAYLLEATTLLRAGIDMLDTATDAALKIAGSVLSDDTTDGVQIHAAGARLDITATGQVEGRDAVHVYEEADIANAGFIHGDRTGIYIESRTGTIVNTSKIIAGDYAIFMGDVNGRHDFTIENDGFIFGGDGGISIGGDNVTITLGKHSSILSDGNGIIIGTSFGQSSIVTNQGTLQGANAAYIGGAGDDTFVNSGEVNGDITLNEGNDTFREAGGTVSSNVFGGSDDDLYVLRSSKVNVFEFDASGTDMIKTSASYDLTGHGEFEVLRLTGSKNINATGNEYEQHLFGNSGDNRLAGGAGADTLIGGKGRDTFIFANGDGHDTVADFKQGEDRILVDAIDGFSSFKDLHIEQVGADVLITFHDNDSLTLTQARLEDFSKSDFLFG